MTTTCMVLTGLIFVLQAFVIVSGTWIQESVPDTSMIYVSATWLSASECILAGNTFQYGTILKSSDGGLTWVSKLSNVNPIYDVSTSTIASVVHLLAVTSSGDIYYSWNKGENWRLNVSVAASLYGVTIGPSTSGNAYAVGILVSASAIYKSTVASTYQTWTLVSGSLAATKQLNGVCTFDGTIVVAVGSSGAIFTSGNGGSTWSTRTSSTTQDIYGVVCPSSTTVYAVGTASVVLKSSNSGATWTVLTSMLGIGTVTSGNNFMLHSVSAVTASTLYLASSGGSVVKSTDSGSTWSLDVTQSNALYCIAAHDSQLVVAGSTGTEYTRVYSK
jgi:photosystem II stability/assembly factor-like uncharacterized protein